MSPPEITHEGAHCENCCPEQRKIHWFEWAVFVFVIATAVATAFAACYARNQWLTAADTEKRQLRAYIGFLPGGVENFGDAKNQLFKMTRRNYGLTPAYNVFSPPTLHDVVKIGGALPSTFNVTLPPNMNTKDTPSIFPSMEHTVRLPGHQMSPTQIELARNGMEYQFIYYGIIFYDDAFGDHHYTRYCWIFKGENMTDKDADACLGHNDSN